MGLKGFGFWEEEVKSYWLMDRQETAIDSAVCCTGLPDGRYQVAVAQSILKGIGSSHCPWMTLDFGYRFKTDDGGAVAGLIGIIFSRRALWECLSPPVNRLKY